MLSQFAALGSEVADTQRVRKNRAIWTCHLATFPRRDARKGKHKGVEDGRDCVDVLKGKIMQLINKKTLLSMIPLSEKAIYNMEKRGDFPRRIALTSRNVAWDLTDITAWIEARKSSGEQAARPGQVVTVS